MRWTSVAGSSSQAEGMTDDMVAARKYNFPYSFNL